MMMLLRTLMWRGERTETSILGDEPPVTGAVLGDVRREFVIFFKCPLPPFHVVLLTTRNPAHLCVLVFCLLFFSRTILLEKC